MYRVWYCINVHTITTGISSCTFHLIIIDLKETFLRNSVLSYAPDITDENDHI